MPYGIRYETQFRSRGGNEYTIEIRKKSLDNDFDRETIQLADPGFIIERPAVARYEPIMGSGCTIHIWNTKEQGQLYFKDLFGTGEYENRVDIYKGGDKIWTGFIVPELYQDVFGARPRAITVTAMDGLSILKNVDYQPVFGAARELEIVTLDAITDVLLLTGHTLQVRIFCNLYPEGIEASEADFPSYSFTLINNEGLIAGNGDLIDGYTILAELLKPFGCFIRQSYDSDTGELLWLIDRWRMLNDNRTFQTYNSDGSYDKPFEVVPIVKEIFTDFEVIDGGGLEYERGFRSEKLSINQKRFSNLITPQLAAAPTGQTTEFKYGTGLQPDVLIRRWYSAIDGYDVNRVALGRDDRLFQWFQPDGQTIVDPTTFSVDGLETGTKFTFSEDIDNEYVIIKVTVDIPEATVREIIEQQSAIRKNYFCVLEVSWTDMDHDPPQEVYVIRHNILTNIEEGIWTGVTADPISEYVRLVSEKLFDGTEDPTLLENQRQTFEFRIPGSLYLRVGPLDVYMQIRLLPGFMQTPFLDNVVLEGAQNVFSIHVVEFVVTAPDGIETNITEGTVNTDFVERYSNSFAFNDVPTYNFSNGFMRPSVPPQLPVQGGRLTSVWEEDYTGSGASEFLPLVDRFLRDSMQAFQVARFQLSIEARSEDINPYDLIDELTVTGKRYIIVGSKFNAKWGVIELSLIEFVKDDGVTIVV